MKQISEEEYQVEFLEDNVLNDQFIHFTPSSRYKEILDSGKLLMNPPYRKFGTDTVNAISLTYGKYLPSVQHTHMEDIDDELVAIVFKTDTIPKVGFREEIAWKHNVNLIDPVVITFDEAKDLLEKVKPPETPLDIDGNPKDFWVEYVGYSLNESMGNMKYINFLKKVTTSQNAALIESLKDAYQLCFEGEYYNETIPEEDKRNSCVYTGRGVTWYGKPGEMAVVHKDIITGMWGNTYTKEKLDELEDMIRNSEDNIEIECSYGIGSVVGFIDLCEQQQAKKNDSFNVDYDGQDEPYSLGDDELDLYVTDAGIEEVVFGGYSSSTYSSEIEKALEQYRLDIALGKYTVETVLSETWDDVQRFIGIEEADENIDDEDREEIAEAKVDFTEAFEEFIRIENQLKEAIENQDGDLGDPSIQLRDSHHRINAAINAGEQYVCVNIITANNGEDDDFIKAISESRLINFVTQKYVPESD